MSKIKDYEWVRERLKREERRPNAYTKNRKQFLLEQAHKSEGAGAVRELCKEFKI
jgi:hypothetical protein